MGAPEALGLTTEDWVKTRLGGYVRMAIPERREAAKELEGEGLSQRQIAAVIGVAQKTVDRDLSESSDSKPATPTHTSESNDSADDDYPEVPGEYVDPDTGEVLGPNDAMRVLREQQASASDVEEANAILDDMDDGTLDRARVRRAFTTGTHHVTAILMPLNPEAVVASLDDTHRYSASLFIRNTRAWLDRLDAELNQGVRLVHRKDA
jgi:hypothetical protein